MTTIRGPHGPVSDSVEMLVGRLGMPDLGGSYFTFSNENNDLIWGFLAECHRRGWLYKGHDTMPWCPRCGTGLSQMEMNEGYQDREDPGLTIRLPLVDRPGESLLVWTTTPWTLAANVAAAVGPEVRYVQVRQGDQVYWLGKGTLKVVLQGRFEVLDERPGSDLVGWRYSGPFDHLPAVVAAFSADGYEHRVVAWDEVGEDEGTGIVHIAPGCGAEDYQLGRALGLPIIAPIDEAGRYVDGFDWLTGREAPDVAEPIVDDLERRHVFYHLEPYRHRYPHCWRCGTPLLFRLVDEWYISMGPVYDQPRETLTAEQVDASLRYQIMEVVDRIRWIPAFGYERELDWLLNMHDWMISKKRYWGLALPIYDCAACGTFDVVGGRDELGVRAVEGWEAFEGHTPHRPHVDAVRIACSGCGAPVSRIPDVGNPWLDAGIVPFSTLHYREDPDYWAQWFPADFITESFPGQFRNWFYSMLAMSTVLRREEPFTSIFGYALVFAEDGRQMHKSWGNAIEFDEAADRMGVDVMRWMFAKARPEDNILFGWHAADEARRELLVLWNVYAFFVTYANLAGWSPADPRAAGRRAGGPRPLDPVPAGRARGAGRGAPGRLRHRRGRRRDLALHRRPLDVVPAPQPAPLLAGRRGGRSSLRLRHAPRRARRAGAHRRPGPAVPRRGGLPEPRRAGRRRRAGQRPPHPLAGGRARRLSVTPGLEDGMAMAQRAVELARTLRSQAGIRTRQPLARLWIALPGAEQVELDALLDLVADEVNVKEVIRIGDESELVERRVKPLLPKIGKKLGPAIPAVMAAAREGRVDIRPDGSVALGGVVLAPDEVEILAAPRPGTAVAHDEGLVVVIDTALTDELRAEGDARELQRAIQDLRRDAGLELDDRIDLVVRFDGDAAGVRPHLPAVAAETLAEAVAEGPLPDGWPAATVTLGATGAAIAIRRRDAVPA